MIKTLSPLSLAMFLFVCSSVNAQTTIIQATSPETVLSAISSNQSQVITNTSSPSITNNSTNTKPNNNKLKPALSDENLEATMTYIYWCLPFALIATFFIIHLMSTSAKWKKIILRWRSITTYSAIGATLTYLLLNNFFPALTPPQSWYTLFETQPIAYWVLVGLILAATHFLARHFKVWNENHSLKSVLIRPNLYIAIGLSGIFSGLILQKPILAFVYWLPFLAALAAQKLSHFLRTILNKSETNIENIPYEIGLEPRELSEQTLRQWLTSEKPLPPTTPWLINYAGIETRITDLFFDNNNLFQPTSLALVANYGMGKTSLLERLEHSINERLKTSESKQTKLVVVTIDCWGRDVKSLDMQIISEVIKAIGKHADVSALYSLPKHYHDALASPRGFWGFISHLIDGQNKDAKKVLEKIEEVLIQLNLQLLIIIEDLDRNQDSSYAALNLVSAVLDRLNKLNSTSIIVSLPSDALLDSIETQKENFDPKGILRRVLRHKEYIYKPNYGPIIKDLTKLFISHARNNGINYCGEPSDPDDLVLDLIDSPRHLKQIFREMFQLWFDNRLYGEINLNDLFVLSAIKYDHLQKTTYFQNELKEYLPNEALAIIKPGSKSEDRLEESAEPDNYPTLQTTKLMIIRNKGLVEPFDGISCLKISESSAFQSKIYETFFTGRPPIYSSKSAICHLNAIIQNPLDTSVTTYVNNPANLRFLLELLHNSNLAPQNKNNAIKSVICSIGINIKTFTEEHYYPLSQLREIINRLENSIQGSLELLLEVFTDESPHSSYQSYWWLYLGLFSESGPDKSESNIFQADNRLREEELRQIAFIVLAAPRDLKCRFLQKSMDFISGNCNPELEFWKYIFIDTNERNQSK